MNYQIAFWAATVVAALLFLLVLWTSRLALKTQKYNRDLFVECLTSHKVRDDALAQLAEINSQNQDKPI
jgi:hypothetical protein